MKENGTDRSVIHAIGTKIGRAPKVLLKDESSRDGSPPVVRKTAEEKLAVPEGRGTYKLLGEIARGGMGVVLKGHDEDLGRDVALKVLHEELAVEPALLERFVASLEAGAAG